MYDDMIHYDDIPCYNDMYVWDAILHYDMNTFGNDMYDMLQHAWQWRVFNSQPLSNVMNDVMYESLCMHVT